MATIISPCGPALPEAYFTDLTLLYMSIQAFTRENGYAFTVRDKQANRVVYMCDRGGSYQSKGKKPEVHPSKQRNGIIKKCNYKIKVTAKRDGERWRVQVIEDTHNHNAFTSAIAHPAHRIRTLDLQIRNLILSKAKAGIRIAHIFTLFRLEDSSILITSKDIANIIQNARSEQLDGWTPIQRLLYN